MAVVRHGPTNGCVHGPGCPHDIGPTQDLAVYSVNTEVERRVLSADELAARVTAAQPLRDQRPAPRSAGGMHVMRQPAARKQPPVTAVEEIPMPTPEPSAPPFTIPCGTCIHARVCGQRDKIPDAPQAPLSMELAPGLRVVSTAFEVQCDDHLPVHALRETTSDRIREHAAVPVALPHDVAMVAAGKREAKKRSPGLGRGGNNRKLPVDPAEREARLLEAVRATTSTGEAGVLLGITATRVQQLLRELRDAGRLPGDITDALKARRSGRRLVVGETAAVQS